MVRTITQRGYTLVELMIAMLILMGLVLSANYSYALYASYWHGRLGSFDQNLFYYQGLLQVKESIDAAIPYMVEEGPKQHTFYFLGRKEGFTLVTGAPIFAQTVNDASVVRIFSEKNALGYQLIYEEAPLANELLLRLDQTLDFKYRVVLMELDQPAHFSYFGWDRYVDKNSTEANPPKPRWHDQYDAAKTRIQPERILLSIDNSAIEFTLPVGLKTKANAFEIGRESL